MHSKQGIYQQQQHPHTSSAELSHRKSKIETSDPLNCDSVKSIISHLHHNTTFTLAIYIFLMRPLFESNTYTFASLPNKKHKRLICVCRAQQSDNAYSFFYNSFQL